MNHVALFRNLNLGHPGSPTAKQLIDAFGGTAAARNFQTNGTVLLESDDPDTTARHALQVLRNNRYDQNMVLRPLSELERLVNETPTADPTENIYRTMISFYDTDRVPAVKLPLRSRDQLVEIRRLDHRSAGSVTWKPRHTAGNVTSFLEELLNVPVTTRTLGTLQRLLTATVGVDTQRTRT